MVKLSASRLKTAFSCSWLYYAKYILKVPDESNSGAARGSVSHNVLETLLRPDRKIQVEEIKLRNDPWTNPAVYRLARMLAKKYGVWNDEDFKLIQNFILVALKLDFFLEGADSVEAEYEFDISGKNWRAGGFIDKIGVYKDEVVIVDYKTSKAKFSKEELNFNLQNYFYTLAAKRRFPDLPVRLQFQFLKIKSPIQDAPVISDDELRGFEQWLEEAGKYLTNFNEKNALDNPASASIKSRWVCGKPAGTIKDDGSIAFTCKFRVPFFYYELYQGDKFLGSSKKKEELEERKEPGQFIVQKKYEGCPVYKHEWS